MLYSRTVRHLYTGYKIFDMWIFIFEVHAFTSMTISLITYWYDSWQISAMLYLNYKLTYLRISTKKNALWSWNPIDIKIITFYCGESKYIALLETFVIRPSTHLWARKRMKFAPHKLFRIIFGGRVGMYI